MTEADTPAPSPRFRSDTTVELVKHSASDTDVLWAARVSTAGEQSLDELRKDPERSRGLINYLMRDRHGSPFEHNSMTFFVSAPLFVFREFHRHRVGWCLAGDTEITLVSEGGRVRREKIAELYRQWHHGTEERPPDFAPDHAATALERDSVRAHQVRCYDEESRTAQRTPIVDVLASGVKRLLRITTRRGSELRCSEDHAILTPDGWRKAGELAAGDSVMAGGTEQVPGERPATPGLHRGVGGWTAVQRDRLISAEDTCHLCARTFPREELALDQVAPVAEDLRRSPDESNLAPACADCHTEKRAGEQAPAQRGGRSPAAVPDEILSVETDGEEETYDLSVEGPWHNFLADGVVVHNSYNEESGRYRELEPVFYVPDESRKLVQQGRPGKYEFVAGSPEQLKLVEDTMTESYRQAYAAYQEMLAAGVAREVARAVLPVGLYSSMYATCNARSLMHFLGLRTKHELARTPSFPQREIEMVAEQMEAQWAELMPLTYAAFNRNGRVAP